MEEEKSSEGRTRKRPGRIRNRERRNAYMREYMKLYIRRPDVKRKRKEYLKKYRQLPWVKLRERESKREYMRRPDVKRRYKE